LIGMKELAVQPKLVEQVQDAILTEITEGKLAAGERIIQEQIAQTLGVSRQPVQQALLLLRNQGVLRDAPGRGLIVAPLDLTYVQNMYEVRSVLEGLAFRKAAEMNAERAREDGPGLIQSGRRVVKSGSVAAMIAADRKFHDFIYELSSNPLIAPILQTQWTNTHRVMGAVLMRDGKPRDIWDQHEAMLAAVMARQAATAERLARQHVMQAATFMITRLSEPSTPARGRRRMAPA
jgi:DNA-binding GntR family transcriptional regulator